MDRAEAGHRGHCSSDGVAGCGDFAAAFHEAQLLCEARQLHLIPLLHCTVTQLHCLHLLLCLQASPCTMALLKLLELATLWTTGSVMVGL